MRASAPLGPHDDGTAISLVERICSDDRITSQERVLRLGQPFATLPTSADADFSTTRLARRVEDGIAENADVLPERMNGAALCASLNTLCLQRAGDADHAGIAAVENDLTVTLDKRVGANSAAVVDERIEQRVGAASGE